MTDPDREYEPTSGVDRRTVLKGTAAAGLGASGALAGRASAHPKPHTITIRAGETPCEYRIRVSGTIEKGEHAGTTDEIADGNVALGFVEAGNEGELDSFDFTGEILAFDVLAGSIRAVTVDGRAVEDPVGLPRSGLSNRITVQARGEDVAYAFRVSGSVEKGPHADDGDRILESNVVEGAVGGEGVDDYRYSGAVAFDEADGPLRVTLDIDP